MTCKNCNANIPESSKFCSQCGSKVESSFTSCGNQLNTNDKFCNTCGQAINTIEHISVDKLKIGNFIEFGKYSSPFDYQERSIVWRIISIDEEGDFLLYSENILGYKMFDSGGEYHKRTRMLDEKTWGSNRWKYSNIRQWLNSTEIIINKWAQNMPVLNDNNNVSYYDKEKGFLANFNKNDIRAIKSNTNKSMNGREAEFTDDLVFLLSKAEHTKYIIETFGTAEDKSNVVLYNEEIFDSSGNDNLKQYWLRNEENESRGYCATYNLNNNKYDEQYPNNASGLVPALYVRKDSINIVANFEKYELPGESEYNPYVIKGK